MLAYFDCFSGISGDMTLGALIDLGVPVEWLQAHLSRIPLDGFDITVNPIQRSGIRAQRVEVEALDDHTSRNYSHIRALIENSPLADSVKTTSLKIFQRLAEAEARIHGCAPDEVHFHEVGGVDAIVDIIGTALGLEYLEVDKIIASPIPLGTGFTKCSHGNLPLPAPATLGILQDVPVYGAGIAHELVTPTGAAIVCAASGRFGPLPEMVIKRIGYGAGQRDLKDRPNLLRVILGKDSPAAAVMPEYTHEDRIEILESCIDDMNPELFGHLMDRLFKDGALDVYWTPVYMKKNRPGTMLQVICRDNDTNAMLDRILSETTTLGVRYYSARRRLLWREQREIDTVYGRVSVKRVRDTRGNLRHVPEYEACRQIALERNIPLRMVYDTIARDADRNND